MSPSLDTVSDYVSTAKYPDGGQEEMWAVNFQSVDDGDSYVIYIERTSLIVAAILLSLAVIIMVVLTLTYSYRVNRPNYVLIPLHNEKEDLVNPLQYVYFNETESNEDM